MGEPVTRKPPINLGAILAFQPRKRFAKDAVLIVDGPLLPARDHAIAEQSQNWYSTNHQVLVDTDSGMTASWKTTVEVGDRPERSADHPPDPLAGRLRHPARPRCRRRGEPDADHLDAPRSTSRPPGPREGTDPIHISAEPSGVCWMSSSFVMAAIQAVRARRARRGSCW